LIFCRGHFLPISEQCYRRTGLASTSRWHEPRQKRRNERLLTLQNAADLQFSADDPANAGVRDEFQLNTFPSRSANGAPTPPPAPKTEGK
jgi:hypothetical protein